MLEFDNLQMMFAYHYDWVLHLHYTFQEYIMKTKYRVRCKGLRWYATFDTLSEAQNHAKTDFGFKDNPNTYIEKIVTEIIEVE